MLAMSLCSLQQPSCSPLAPAFAVTCPLQAAVSKTLCSFTCKPYGLRGEAGLS